ncbi:hypothetical protein PHYSODRAFT_543468, partial [Phytophthora sojae]
MRDLALAPANACCDESIRAWSEAEEGTLLAYTSGMLELPHPPNFIKEILVSEHRALPEDFHEAHMNYTLTTNLPPYVNLPRNAPHRFIYDGSHTLSFVFYSKRAAQSWVKKVLRFQRAVISLHDTVRRPQDEGTGSFSPALLELQYALYVHGAGALGLAALARAMSQFAGTKVLDVEYPRSQKTDIYDNRFHKVIFAQAKCPDALMGVTRVDLNGTMITLHHFQANLRFPCTRCFNARHSAKMCKVPGRLLAKTQARCSRVYKGEVTKVTPAGDSAYRVNSVTELLALFTAQQDELAQNGSALLERTEVVTTANDTSSIAPSASSPALTTPADVRLDAASSLTARDDGFAVKRSKKDQRAVKKTEQTSHSTQSAAKNAKISAAVGAKTSKSSTKQKPSAKAKSRTKQATGFAAFQRAEALGQYGPLADDDSDEDDNALEELGVLSRNANVNAMLLRNMNMRDRLDIVLARLGFPTLSTAELDERELEATMTTEEMIIHEAYGVDGYASGSQSSSAKVEGATQLPSRSPRIASGKVVEDVYIRLLRAISTDAIREEDRPQCELMQAANQEAFSRWVSLYRESLGIPMMKRTQTKVDFLRPWLLNNCTVLRHLFAFLPYPELEVKT